MKLHTSYLQKYWDGKVNKRIELAIPILLEWTVCQVGVASTTILFLSPDSFCQHLLHARKKILPRESGGVNKSGRSECRDAGATRRLEIVP